MAKECSCCGNVGPIWKNKEGNKYCKRCWLKQSGGSLNKISAKKKKENAEYSKARKSFLKEKQNSYCKAAMPGCTGKDASTLTIHHMKGRGRFTLDQETWVTLCFNCHRWVEEHPSQAKLLGLSLNRLENYDRKRTKTQPGEE